MRRCFANHRFWIATTIWTVRDLLLALMIWLIKIPLVILVGAWTIWLYSAPSHEVIQTSSERGREYAEHEIRSILVACDFTQNPMTSVMGIYHQLMHSEFPTKRPGMELVLKNPIGWRKCAWQQSSDFDRRLAPIGTLPAPTIRLRENTDLWLLGKCLL